MDASKIPHNTIHAGTYAFYEELDHAIQKEPLDFLDPELRGLAGCIGLHIGTPFTPDARLIKNLTKAVAVANPTARSMRFHSRDPRSFLYPNSQWKPDFVGGDHLRFDRDGLAGQEKTGAKPSRARAGLSSCAATARSIPG